MGNRYEVVRLNGGFVVTMTANGHIIAKFFETKDEAGRVCEQFEAGEIVREDRPDVWVVGAYVVEPYVGGQHLGEVGSIDLRQYNVVRRLTGEEFDTMCEEQMDEDGHWPDT